MNQTSLISLIDTFEKSLFRLQTLPSYSVGGEEEVALHDYLSGTPLPTTANWEWFKKIEQTVSGDRSWTNIHLLSDPLSDYTRFAIEWAYVFFDRAGADAKFVVADMADKWPNKLRGDFYLFDRSVAVQLNYDSQGAPLEPLIMDDIVTVQKYAAAADYWLERSIDLRKILQHIRCDKVK